MARAKRKDVATNDEAVKAFTDRCFKGSEVMCIHPYFDEIYVIDAKEYRFTHEVLNDMLETGKVKATYINSKEVNLIGVII